MSTLTLTRTLALAAVLIPLAAAAVASRGGARPTDPAPGAALSEARLSATELSDAELGVLRAAATAAAERNYADLM